jgi:hypothetical protein
VANSARPFEGANSPLQRDGEGSVPIFIDRMPSWLEPADASGVGFGVDFSDFDKTEKRPPSYHRMIRGGSSSEPSTAKVFADG